MRKSRGVKRPPTYKELRELCIGPYLAAAMLGTSSFSRHSLDEFVVFSAIVMFCTDETYRPELHKQAKNCISAAISVKNRAESTGKWGVSGQEYRLFMDSIPVFERYLTGCDIRKVHAALVKLDKIG